MLVGPDDQFHGRRFGGLVLGLKPTLPGFTAKVLGGLKVGPLKLVLGELLDVWMPRMKAESPRAPPQKVKPALLPFPHSG